ncbi:MAG: hypothetical protein IJV64_09910 [Oscillospiraceae bacterium]|nr:hypothetical protein [Oscillospiraceae bacterium]
MGLSKRETIWYYKCDGCGLRTGKRLTVDEAAEAAIPTYVAAGVTESLKDYTPPEVAPVWRIAKKMRNLEHRILLLREKKGLSKVGCGVSFYRMTMVLTGSGTRETIYHATYEADGEPERSWEGRDALEMLEEMDADVRKWEAEA